MSRGDLIRVIQIELEELNKKIDLKIIKGRSYKKEAKRHKFLLSQLTYLKHLAEVARFAEFSRFNHRKGVVSNWMMRTARMVSTFVF